LLGDGSVQGITDFGGSGYGGPCPPKGKPHGYFFRIYALDTKMELSGDVSSAALENAMKGHILAKGELVGLYGR